MIKMTREEKCNGCKHLDFRRKVCVRVKDKIVPLNTYTQAPEEDGDYATGYVTVFRPSSCTYTPEEVKQ